MITKALVIGAPPRPFEGPWVAFPEGGGWEIDVPEELLGKVNLEISGTPPTILEKSKAGFVAQMVRVSILEDVEGMKDVSIIARRIS